MIKLTWQQYGKLLRRTKLRIPDSKLINDPSIAASLVINGQTYYCTLEEVKKMR